MPAGVVHRGDPRRLPAGLGPDHGSGMEINGEIEVDLGALADAAERWQAAAAELVAVLETLRTESGSADLEAGVTEALTHLVGAWTRAGAGLCQDLAEDAAAFASSAHEYDAADAHAAIRHRLACAGPTESTAEQP